LQSRHAELFYVYRNHLVHEFREPGYGMEFDKKDTTPHYMNQDDGAGNQRWELCYPTGFFTQLVTNTLANLRNHLERNDLDPYSFYEFGSIWERH